jgi:hypothetical protein
MSKLRWLALWMALAAAACVPSTPGPAPQDGATGPAASPTPIPSETPTPLPADAPITVLIDDFEAGEAAWQAGTEAFFPDSSAVSLALSPEHASGGLQALQLNFDLTDKPKAIFFLDRELDLSRAPFLQFDLFNPGSAAFAAAAVTTGPEHVWYESSDFPLASGQQTRVVFDLTAGDYKAASTNWEFRAAIADLNAVHRLAIIIIPASSGSAYLDSVLLTNTPPVR